ncbi:hypothetical protein cypCar_00039989 [Cyprinus carpio]|nr:hypothetical protein cypCar_00039989 [Cyprinus carpio]
MQLFWKETKGILTKTPNKTCYGDIPFSPGTVGVSASLGSTGEMFQGFPGDPDTGSRGSSSPSFESQYLSSVESFGSPPTTSAPQEDTFYLPPAYSSHHHHVPVSQPTQTQPAPAQQQQGMMQEVAFSSSFYGQGQPAPDGPCLVADGGGNPDAGSYIPSYTSSFVFTYPEGACGASANQRTSSSDQSSDSLNSPSLLAL